MKNSRNNKGPDNRIHRPSLGEYREVDRAYSIGKKLAESGKRDQAVYFLRAEYERISHKWKGCTSESIEEYKT